MTSNYFDVAVRSFGDKQEYFPGTGGNISYKIDDETMIIKASGKRIKDMNEGDAVVGLLYKDVKEYFHNVPMHDKGEKESLDVVINATHKGQQGRPSIETGFHALLSRATIHSHSVYVNMMTCSSVFESMVDTIFLGSAISYMCISYAKPGYHLTHLFLEKVRKLSSRPRVIFMKNHGVVVTAETFEEAIVLHEEVNNKIKVYFGFKDDIYPASRIGMSVEGLAISETQFLRAFVRNNMHVFENINDHILFPDLTVFCQDMCIVDDTQILSKININRVTGEITYSTSEREALCIEENLIAFAFLFTYMKEHNLRSIYISEAEAVSIRNMEQEKYRKMLLASR